MNRNNLIIDNFKVFDSFLILLKEKDKKILTSLKMMYSIHMKNVDISNNKLFVTKQLVRFIGKVIMIPFHTVYLEGKSYTNGTAILENTKIEENISLELNIPVIRINKLFSMNLKAYSVYKKLFRSIYILLKNRELNKLYVLSLIHRLIDYLMVYETVDIGKLKLLLIENDRSPLNLGLVHRCIESEIKTIKYDNWLIDPINHNDVYCKYYYYPSIYHKKIIQNFESNDKLIYVKGGFPYWDNLLKYKNVKENRVKKIVYFTQFGISLETHKKYIVDIENSLKELGIKHEMVIKIHPREDSVRYKKLLKDFCVIGECHDVYALIEGVDYCFSIFSTISLEAKHIMKNSFFINYDSNNFDIVDYDALKLDLIRDKKMLKGVFKGEFEVISKDKFIQYANCQYPNSIENLKRLMNGFNNNPII